METTKEQQIEQIAREEWAKLGAFTNSNGNLKSEWEFWLKAFEISLSMPHPDKKYDEIDMGISWENGALHERIPDNSSSFEEWIKNLKEQNKK